MPSAHRISVLLLASLALAACGGGSDGSPAVARVIGLTDDNRLLAFAPASPRDLLGTTAVTGLVAGEVLRGVDFRPADGKLYGLTNAGRLYTLEPATGAATRVAVLMPDPEDGSDPFTGIHGAITSVDFDPRADRLRAVTSQGMSLRIAVETRTVDGVTVTAGQTITDGNVNRAGAAASVVASAHAHGDVGPTVLYHLEQDADQLTRQSPDHGALADIGPLGVDITGSAAFDIAAGADGPALAALRAGAAGPFSLYEIALATGQATLYKGRAARSVIGGATGPDNLIDLAIVL